MLHVSGRLLSRLSVVLAAWLLAACAALPRFDADAGLLDGMVRADIVLLGELHDNVVQHRLRLQWLRALSERTQVAIVLEHLDADAQPRLDQARVAQDPACP